MTATLYAAKGGSAASALYILDPITGAATSIGSTGYALTGLAVDPTDGTIYGSTSTLSPLHIKSLVTIDPVTGAGTFIGGISGGPVADICFDASGQLYGWDEATDDFVRIDKATGTTTTPSNAGLDTFGDGCDINPVDGVFHVCPKGGPSPSGSNTFDGIATHYTVNTTTGVPTLIGLLTGGPVNNNPAVGAASFAADGVLWAIFNSFPTDYLVTINVATGVVSSVATLSGTKWDALAWTPSASPPVANFSATPVEGPASLTVAFTDLSTNTPTSWAWDFGDGGTSSAQNPTHVYTLPGVYDVTLTASN